MNPGTEFERYILESPLSHKGGTASVYLAHLKGLPDRKVAIKIAHTDPAGATHEDVLLQYEAVLLQQAEFRHPYVVRIFPTPLDGRKPEYAIKAIRFKNQPWYMVMEYLRGKSLAENLAAIQKYPIQWKIELFYQILIAVGAIHNNGYAHRDLKPSNIVFRDVISPDISPQPVLIDFALATDKIGERAIVDNSYTLEYASPERILRSQGVDVPIDNIKAADVWSLGLILFEILTGNGMLRGKKDIKTTIVRDELTPYIPDAVGEYVALTNLITAMLNKSPDNRPSIALLLHAFENIFLPPWVGK